MALINCTECNKEYSNKAKACPNCGCPTMSNTISEKRKKIEQCNVDITGKETFKSSKHHKNKLINRYTWILVSVLSLMYWIWALGLSSSETTQFLGNLNSEGNRFIFFILLPFSIIFLSPIMVIFTPEYKKNRQEARIINDYFKKKFILLDTMPESFSDTQITNIKAVSNEEVMFNLYMEAYKFNADSIVINDSNVTTHVSGSVSTSAFSKSVSGKTTSTNTFHITATLVKY